MAQLGMALRGPARRASALALMFLAACSVADSPSTSGRTAEGPSGVGVARHTVTVDGRSREYLLDAPQRTMSPHAYPLILAFHAGFATAKGFARTTHLGEAAVAAGFVVVFLEGTGRSWNAGDCCGPAHREGVDDIAFAKAVLEDVRGILPVDDSKINATGFSNWAAMAYRLACEPSVAVTAVAAVGSAMRQPPDDCRPRHPVGVLHIHGLADEYAPIAGGLGRRRQAGEQPAVSDTVQFWAHRAGCTEEHSRAGPNPRVRESRYVGCDDVQVVLMVVRGLGHQWPGGITHLPAQLGPQVDDLSATNLAVDFFRRHGAP